MKLIVTTVILVMLLLCGSLSSADPTDSGQVVYEGGPILSGQVNIYIIFYGTWQDQHQNLLMDFIDNLGNTAWFNTLRLYTDSLNNKVTGPLKFNAAMSDQSSHGNSLQGNATHIDIIQKAIATGYLGNGVDHSGIYFILGGEDVDDVGLCTDWCGYNSYTTEFVYAFIGHPNRCNNPAPSNNRCIPHLNREVSPNGDPAIDAIVGNLAHELIDMLTDPLGNGWRISNTTNGEIAERCMPPYVKTDEWYPNATKLDNGASWNLQVNATQWLIQGVWNPSTNQCTMSS